MSLYDEDHEALCCETRLCPYCDVWFEAEDALDHDHEDAHGDDEAPVPDDDDITWPGGEP